MTTPSLKLGSTWVNDRGHVYTLVYVSETIATFERRTTEPGVPGFCKPYDVVEREPVPIEWAGTKYKPKEAAEWP